MEKYTKKQRIIMIVLGVLVVLTMISVPLIIILGENEAPIIRMDNATILNCTHPVLRDDNYWYCNIDDLGGINETQK